MCDSVTMEDRNFVCDSLLKMIDEGKTITEMRTFIKYLPSKEEREYLHTMLAIFEGGQGKINPFLREQFLESIEKIRSGRV